jgi:hypothetical protein
LLEHRQETATLGGWIGALSQQLVQGATLNELHGQKGTAVGQPAVVMDWRDSRVLQLGGDVCLGGKAVSGAGVGGELVLEHFDRHLAAERGVRGAPDDAHAPVGDLVEQLVSAVAQPGRRVGRSDAPRSRRVGARIVAGEIDAVWLGGQSVGGGMAVGLIVIGHSCPPDEANVVRLRRQARWSVTSVRLSLSRLGR